MWARHLLFKAIATITAVQLSACINSDQTANSQSYLTSIAEITENIDSFWGKSISVRNDVLETIGDRGIILDQDRILKGEVVLVVDITQTPLALSTTDTPEIIVSGKVERFNFDDVQQKYRLNLERNLYAGYEGKPAIFANSVILSPDPEDLNNNPQAYYDQPLAIQGEVEDVSKYGLFELDEEQAFGGEDLLVVQVKSKIKLHEEQTIIVYGVLRSFLPDELERNYNLGWDLAIKKQIETEYNHKLVLVAEKIQVLMN